MSLFKVVYGFDVLKLIDLVLVKKEEDFLFIFFFEEVVKWVFE